MAQQQEFGRIWNTARQEQGFQSQAQLDAFFAHYDHVKACTACHAQNGATLLHDGWQPTVGECPRAQDLYTAYLGSF